MDLKITDRNFDFTGWGVRGNTGVKGSKRPRNSRSRPRWARDIAAEGQVSGAILN